MAKEKPSVLLVGREGAERMQAVLRPFGLELSLAANLEAATERFDARFFDLTLLEVADDSPTELSDMLAWIGARSDSARVFAFGPAQLESAALSAGAVGYLMWPEAEASSALQSLILSLSGRPDDELDATPLRHDSGLLGDSPHITAVKETIARVATGASTVLVRGETGTGKELVARAVHEASGRRRAAFIKVHAAALPDALLESELFGYEKGAFTGANARKAGRVELAEGGTLFFDEIGEVSPVIQAKLLRLIQDREYERLGGTRTLRADIRFIAATHRDLEQMVSSGTFREDLFYRLNVVTVWLPPLRARRKDIAVIAQHYFRRFCAENGKPQLELQQDALRLMQAQRWPGNVRQLVNFIERLVVLGGGTALTEQDVQANLEEQSAFLTQATSQGLPPNPSTHEIVAAPLPCAEKPVDVGARFDSNSPVLPLREETRRMEFRVLTKALQSAKGNRTLAARMLGVSRRTLYTKLDEHGIE